ncbi:MAG: prepilin-type N-terminal cleavage/methylation domain-containing protein [Verrucomicrobiota bacterium]|nr:prepilin-type N-terminal cleavage/methylation domain-containing protein [Verrucomicrobiota bacterium]
MRTERIGFTLIELVVVIVIIGIQVRGPDRPGEPVA